MVDDPSTRPFRISKTIQDACAFPSRTGSLCIYYIFSWNWLAPRGVWGREGWNVRVWCLSTIGFFGVVGELAEGMQGMRWADLGSSILTTFAREE